MPYHNVLVKLKLHILIPFNDKIICVVINMIMFWQSCFGVNFRGGTWSAPQLFVFLYSSFSSTSSAASLTRILRLLRLPFFLSSQIPWDKYTNTDTNTNTQIQKYKCTNTNCAASLTRILCLLRLSLFLPWDGDQHRISWDIKVYLICKYFQRVKHWIHLLHVSYTYIYLIFHEDISHFM